MPRAASCSSALWAACADCTSARRSVRGTGCRRRLQAGVLPGAAIGDATRGRTGRYAFLLTDLGNTQHLTDASQDAVLNLQYNAWGAAGWRGRGRGGTMLLRGNADWGYYTDVGATTPIWVRERCLAAGQGRWLSQDPIGSAGGPNLYGYVGNRPTRVCRSGRSRCPGADRRGHRRGRWSDLWGVCGWALRQERSLEGS